MNVKGNYKKARKAVKENPFKTVLTAFMVALTGAIVHFTEVSIENHKEVKANQQEQAIDITHAEMKSDLLKDRMKDMDADLDSIKKELRHKK